MTLHRWFVRKAVLLAAMALLPGCSDRVGPPDGGMDGTPEFRYALGNPTNAVEIDDPSALAVDRNGNIYVVDNDNNYFFIYDLPRYIHKLGSDGRLLARWPVPEQNVGPAADPGSRVGTRSSADFQSPAYPSLTTTGDDVLLSLPSRSRIFRFNALGVVTASWGTFGSGAGQFRSVQEVAVDGEGRVYVLDGGNFRVQKFAADGLFLKEWGRQGTHDGEFESTIGMAVDPDGFVYVADRDLERIQKFDLEGGFVGSWEVPAGSSSGLSRLAIDRDGNLLLLMSHDRLMKWSPAGDLLDEWSTRVSLGPAGNSSSSVYAVATDPAGTILTLDVGWGLIMRFTPQGDWIESLGFRYGDSASEFRSPSEIVVDGLGNVYIVAFDTIFVFSRDGEFILSHQLQLNSGYSDFIRDMALWSLDSVLLQSLRSGYFEFHSDGTLTPLAFVEVDGAPLPADMASDARDGIILLRDRLVTVHGAAGELLLSFSFDLAGGEGNSYPNRILRGPGGTFWVVYSHYFSGGSEERIRRFSASGAYLGDMVLPAEEPEHFFDSAVGDLAFDSDGFLHVLSGTSKKITRFSRGGDIAGEWFLEANEDSPFPFRRLAFDGSSSFYVVDGVKDRVLKFAY